MEKTKFLYRILIDKTNCYIYDACFIIDDDKIIIMNDDILCEFKITEISKMVTKTQLISKYGEINNDREYAEGKHFKIGDVIYTASRNYCLKIRGKNNIEQYLDFGIKKYTNKIIDKIDDRCEYMSKAPAIRMYDCGSNIIYSSSLNSYNFSVIIPKLTQNISGNIYQYMYNFRIIKGNCIGTTYNKDKNDKNNDNNKDKNNKLGEEIIYDVYIKEILCDISLIATSGSLKCRSNNYLIAIDMNNNITRLYKYDDIYSKDYYNSRKVYDNDKIYLFSRQNSSQDTFQKISEYNIHDRSQNDNSIVHVFNFQRNNFELDSIKNLYFNIDINNKLNNIDLLNPEEDKIMEMYNAFPVLNKISSFTTENKQSEITINNSQLYIHDHNNYHLIVHEIPKNINIIHNRQKILYFYPKSNKIKITLSMSSLPISQIPSHYIYNAN